jgi:hypothetical protein
LQLRDQSRRLLARPDDAQEHLKRVELALILDGTEPVQGALADMFVQLDDRHIEDKRSAFNTCANRLSPRVRAEFEMQLGQGALSRINTVATRWSLLSIPTADIPARVRRCSLDDSRKLAQLAIQAFKGQDFETQQNFLDHCMTCHDKMAFMLARREVLRLVDRLPSDWHSVGNRLESL